MLNTRIKFQFTFSQLCFILAFFAVIILPAALGSETYRMTAYYPAPYAAYQKVRALRKITTGTGGLVEFGNVFTGINSGSIKTPEIYTNNTSASIFFAPKNGKITMGGTLYKFCKWVKYSTTQKDTNGANQHQKDAYCTTGWNAVAIASRAASNSICSFNNITYKPSQAKPYGCMLCCRFSASP